MTGVTLQEYSRRLRLYQGSTFAIYYIEKKSGQRIKVPIIEGSKRNLFIALFSEDDVDFEIEVDNKECKRRSLRFQLDVNGMSRAFIQKNNTRGILETLFPRGKKFHLNRQSGLMGQRLVEDFANAMFMDDEDASILSSQIFFTTQYSRTVQEYQIHVKFGPRKFLTLTAEPWDTISILKDKIKLEIQIPSSACQKLYLEDEPDEPLMEYDQGVELTLRDYDIVHGTVLYLSYDCCIKLCKKQPGSTEYLNIQSSDSIKNVKQRIEDNLDIHPDQQRLKWKGKLLPDGLVLNWLRVTEKYPLVLTYDIYPVYVIRTVGETTKLQVRSSITVASLKIMIERQTGIPRRELSLKSRGIYLDNDGQTLKKYGIFDNATIIMSSKQASKTDKVKSWALSESDFQIFIKPYHGQSYPVLVNSSFLVDNLMAIIEEREISFLMDYRLVFGNKRLKCGHTMRDYNITKNTTVAMYLNVRGGANHSKSGRVLGFRPNSMKMKRKIRSLVGERGVISFNSSKSKQILPPASFVPDETIDVQSFTLEMRMMRS